MPPTKTPLLSHISQNVKSGYPAPRFPNAEERPPLLQSSSLPNLRDSVILIAQNDDNKPIYHRSKSCFRWVVLFLSCWGLFGNYYCYDNPTALATQLEYKYDLSDTQYNLLYSVYSIPNIILPLFGGALVDKIGADISLLIFLSLCSLGQALFAFAASINSYPLMLLSRVIFGLGGESTCVASTALLAVYFVGEEVAFAMGLNLSLGRAGSALNDYLTLKLYNMHHSIPFALWAGFLLQSICLIATVIMIILDRLKAKQKKKQGYFVPQAHSGEVVQLSDIREFNALYWLITISCVVVYGCVLPWNNIGSAFMQSQYGMTSKQGNSHLMIPYLLSVFCVPLFGYICDRMGRRSELLIASTAALAGCHLIFAWLPSVSPLVPLAMMGVAYSIYASAIWPAVALVVKESKLGTAYGFITSVQNGGLALFPIVVGQLTAFDNNPKNKYLYVEILFFGLGCLGVFVGLILWILDRASGSKLAKPSIHKEAKQAEDRKVGLIQNDGNDEETDEANVTVKTPQLLYEQYDEGCLEHSPMAMAQQSASAKDMNVNTEANEAT